MNGFAPLNTQDSPHSVRSASRAWLPFTALCLIALLLFLRTPPVARADMATPAPARSSMTTAPAPRSPLVAGFLDPRSHLPAFVTRRTMLQIGVVGMCLALYIIIWRR